MKLPSQNTKKIVTNNANANKQYNINTFLTEHKTHHATAIKEIGVGKKSGCWIFTTFPQIAGIPQELGCTYANGGQWAIPTKADAQALYNNEEFRKNYIKALEAVDTHCKTNEYTIAVLDQLFGNSIDRDKFISSLTLFQDVAKERGAIQSKDVLMLINRFIPAAKVNDIEKCKITTDILQRQKAEIQHNQH